MIYIVYTVHVLVCLFLILVVLLQQGKGADLSVFGGGSTQTAFGAVGATSLLHKLTVTSFVLFILTTMTIAISQRGGGTSVVKQLGGAAATAEEQAQETPGTEAGTPEAGTGAEVSGAEMTAAPEGSAEAPQLESTAEEAQQPPPAGGETP